MSDAMREALEKARPFVERARVSYLGIDIGLSKWNATCDSILAEIDAALKSSPPDAWRPIDTAPKDEGILLTDARVIGWTQIAAWDEHHQGWQADDSPAIWHRAMFTHWMPLPAPPVAQVKEG